MTPPSASSSSAAFLIAFSLLSTAAHSLGTGSTLAVLDSSPVVCGVSSGQTRTSVKCFSPTAGGPFTLSPSTASFSSISGGSDSICGLRTGGHSVLCWDNLGSSDSIFTFKRIYNSATSVVDAIALGASHLCGLLNGTNESICWRIRRSFRLPPEGETFSQVSSGFGFTCGVSGNGSIVRCWGSNGVPEIIQNEFGDMPMLSIVAGGYHACGINTTGQVVCKGRNDYGQLDVPFNQPLEYSMLSLGARHSCAIRRLNNTIVCWGDDGSYSEKEVGGLSFELIASGVNFTCGLTTSNFSVLCWGSGWPSGSTNSTTQLLPLAGILPGPCVDVGSCRCGIFALSQNLCHGDSVICSRCEIELQLQTPPALPHQEPSLKTCPQWKGLSKKLQAFVIMGSVGTFIGLCSAIYILWAGSCLGRKKVHNSVQPTITKASSNNNSSNSNSNPLSRSTTIRRQGSRIMRRQRSGTSSKHADRAEEFSLAELAAATNFFSLENKIGSGSFGLVFCGKLSDGREVAIKRGETGLKLKKLQEKESAFDSELAFLSRLHHRHLVRLVGYCEENDERLLVYEYMANGALYDHLHKREDSDKSSSPVDSWKMRIKIALEAAKGIEYLHCYAVPPIIHRDIKSSNILLDANLSARVSDFGLSLMGPELYQDGKRPLKAAGTVGYIDPEYYGLNVLTAKSDVYGLGVVLLELLTGKRAIFRNGGEGSTPMSVVDYAVPAIMAGELTKVLDKRVPPADVREGEAVELMGYTAMHCVNLEGKDRPTMSDIVLNLERALAVCDGSSHGSVSSRSSTSIVAE